MITRFLIVVNALAYLWESVGRLARKVRASLYGAALVPAAVLQDHQWWRIITGGFLHGGLIHIGVNMMSLWFLGTIHRVRAGLVAHAARLYGVADRSGVGRRLFQQSDDADAGQRAARSSGSSARSSRSGLSWANLEWSWCARTSGFLVINLHHHVYVPVISWQAHVAGLLAGFVLTFAIYYPPRRVAPVVVESSTGRTLESQYESPHDRQHWTQ